MKPKHKSQYTAEEIAQMDADAHKAKPTLKFGSSKHRQARIQKFTAKQRKKKNKRKHR